MKKIAITWPATNGTATSGPRTYLMLLWSQEPGCSNRLGSHWITYLWSSNPVSNCIHSVQIPKVDQTQSRDKTGRGVEELSYTLKSLQSLECCCSRTLNVPLCTAVVEVFLCFLLMVRSKKYIWHGFVMVDFFRAVTLYMYYYYYIKIHPNKRLGQLYICTVYYSSSSYFVMDWTKLLITRW